MSKTFYVDKPVAGCRSRQSDPFDIYATPSKNRTRICVSDNDARHIADWHIDRRTHQSMVLQTIILESTKIPTHILIEEDCGEVVMRGLAPWPGLSEEQEQACRDLEFALLKCEPAGVVIAIMNDEILATTEAMMEQVAEVMVESMLRGHGELYKATHPPFGRKLDDQEDSAGTETGKGRKATL